MRFLLLLSLSLLAFGCSASTYNTANTPNSDGCSYITNSTTSSFFGMTTRADDEVLWCCKGKCTQIELPEGFEDEDEYEDEEEPTKARIKLKKQTLPE